MKEKLSLPKKKLSLSFSQGLLGVGLLILFFISCQPYDGTTESEYSYVFHVDEEGLTPQVGDQVIFREDVFHNEELIASTDEYGLKEIILPPEAILTRPLPPNYEILFKMSPGDSVTVVQKLEGLQNLPQGYKTEDELKYVVTLLEVIPKEKIIRKKKGRTVDNYPFEIFRQTGNVVAQPGDRVIFNEYHYTNDMLVFSSDQPVNAILPPRTKVISPPPGNYVALLMGGIGDSLQMDQLLEEAKELPQDLGREDTIRYRIKILDVITPGEYVIRKLKDQLAQKQAVKDAKARKSEIEKMAKANIKKYEADELDDDLEYTQSGLKYLIHEKGNGRLPNPTKKVEVHYAGFLMDGTMFDSSFESGKPIKFPLGMGRVIKGWDEGISKLPIGSKATLFVPFQLAYGVMGRPPHIPIRSDLVFYVEVVDAD
ncbi:MAG: FKBP-type peptidyl-prolyl cis-trans isomerase [Bacteroidota bacterium]